MLQLWTSKSLRKGELFTGHQRTLGNLERHPFIEVLRSFEGTFPFNPSHWHLLVRLVLVEKEYEKRVCLVTSDD